MARLQGSHCDQSVQPAFSACSMIRPRKPEQSTNRSASISVPSCIFTDWTSRPRRAASRRRSCLRGAITPRASA